MFPERPEFSIQLQADTQLLKMIMELTRHIATLYQFTTSDAQRIALAVDEAVTNVIKHSYQNSQENGLQIDYYLSSDGLKIKLIYRGVPPVIDQDKVNLATLIKNKKKGGLGVEMMKRIMDSVKYQTVDGINTCEMVKWKKAV
jgi:serine/threonine-protein kinase RsbW